LGFGAFITYMVINFLWLNFGFHLLSWYFSILHALLLKTYACILLLYVQLSAHFVLVLALILNYGLVFLGCILLAYSILPYWVIELLIVSHFPVSESGLNSNQAHQKSIPGRLFKWV
jgi:hypothetical protein